MKDNISLCTKGIEPSSSWYTAEVAERISVSYRFISRLWNRFRETGSSFGNNQMVDALHHNFLVYLLEDKLHNTLICCRANNITNEKILWDLIFKNLASLLENHGYGHLFHLGWKVELVSTSSELNCIYQRGIRVRFHPDSRGTWGGQSVNVERLRHVQQVCTCKGGTIMGVWDWIFRSVRTQVFF